MRLKALHHVHFAVTNLQATRKFAEDFGLVSVADDGRRIYMRTSGGDAYSYIAEQADVASLKGIAFVTETIADLEEAVRNHGASPLMELDAPGGGSAVTLAGPEGVSVMLVHGIDNVPPAQPPESLRLNTPGVHSRHSTPQATRPVGPANLFRLGHIGLYVKDFAVWEAWLAGVLGMKASDYMYAGDPEHRIVGFFRLDRGAEWVDHHTLFVGQMGKTDCHHISFEVQDYEAQFRTHRWLGQQGWEPNWGVGRHPLGSHVFDVWFSPDRYRFETFSDTDLVNSDHATGSHNVAESEMDLWSSDPPDRYFA